MDGHATSNAPMIDEYLDCAGKKRTFRLQTYLVPTGGGDFDERQSLGDFEGVAEAERLETARACDGGLGADLAGGAKAPFDRGDAVQAGAGIECEVEVVAVTFLEGLFLARSQGDADGLEVRMDLGRPHESR